MSTPDWWGNWRPNLPAHTGDLKPTDLIECTSIVGGLPVNTAITGQQIIDAASGGGATWGSITGTLSSQTDLQSALTAKQDALISGTNIKTVNSTSLLGSGNVAVQPTLVSGTNIKTVNGSSLLGSGDLTVSANPRLLGFKGTTGTPAASAVAICHSILIPANTLTTNSILQVIFRMYRQTGNVGQMYGRIYFNTTNSLTGASLFPTIFTMSGGSTQYLGLVERNFAYNGTTLTSYSNTAFSDYTTGTSLTVSLNRAVDNYVLLTMQTQNVSEVANIDLVKVFAYV